MHKTTWTRRRKTYQTLTEKTLHISLTERDSNTKIISYKALRWYKILWTTLRWYCKSEYWAKRWVDGQNYIVSRKICHQGCYNFSPNTEPPIFTFCLAHTCDSLQQSNHYRTRHTRNVLLHYIVKQNRQKISMRSKQQKRWTISTKCNANCDMKNNDFGRLTMLLNFAFVQINARYDKCKLIELVSNIS